MVNGVSSDTNALLFCLTALLDAMMASLLRVGDCSGSPVADF